MEFENGQLLELDGMDVCILDIENIDSTDYMYVGEMVDDDITGNFYVYKFDDKNIEKVVNSDELKNVLPVFINSMAMETEMN